MVRESQNVTHEEENSLKNKALGITLFATSREDLYQRAETRLQPQRAFLRRIVCIQ